MQSSNCALSVTVLERSITQQTYPMFSHNTTEKPENSVGLMALICDVYLLFCCFVELIVPGE